MNDSPANPLLSQAEARSQAARERLLTTLGEVKTKLNPKTLAQDTVGNVASTMGNVANNVMRDTVETARARPGTVAAAAGVAVLFLARKPLARLIRRSRIHETTLSASFKGRESSTKGSDL